MMMALSIFRQYTYDDSFLQVLVSSSLLKEYQIALIFARDYDESGSPTNGIFHIYWDQTKLTPSTIARFKQNLPRGVELKVFLSIGDRDYNYRFHPLDNQSWISNATKSLTTIIQDQLCDVGIAGIDIFYEHIDAQPNDFAQCTGQLIKNLKEAQVITVASISPSASLNQDFYQLTYRRYATLIEWVVYQFQNEETFVANPDILENRYNAISAVYPRNKLFAGYSAQNDDWANLSPIVFFLGGSKLLKKKNKVAGFSILYHDFGNHTFSSSSNSPP